MIQYTVEKTLAEIGSTGSTAKRLTVTSWNGNPAKLDLRAWRIDQDGNESPGKGLTMTDQEAAALADALTAYLEHRDQ